MSFLFGKKPDPKEQVRKWQSQLRHEMRAIDRQIREIQREEAKVVKSCKEAAKRKDLASTKILAKEIVTSRKTVSRLYANKAQMNSVSLHLGEQLAMVKAVGQLQKSTEVMQLVSGLVKVPELNQTMMELSKEMMKAGLIEETINDTLESTLDYDDIEEETDEEVAKIMQEIAGDVGIQLPSPGKEPVGRQEEVVEEEEESELDELRARLDAVRT